MINISNLNISATPYFTPAQICEKDGAYSVTCLNAYFCPQISQYFVWTGIYIIIGVIVASWALNWLLTHGYKRLKPHEDIYIKFYFLEAWIPLNLNNFANRVWWDTFIRDKMLKICLIYIGILIYYFLRL